MRDQRSGDAPDRQDKPDRPSEQAEQHRQPATDLNYDRQDPSRFHHWQTLLDKHCLRGRRPEQFDRTADEEQKAQQYAPEEHRRIVGSLHSSSPLLSAFWRGKRSMTLLILQSFPATTSTQISPTWRTLPRARG